MEKKFVHLHLHSQYSFLDGAIRLKDLIPKMKEYNMDSVAVTDHGNMHGALEFYKAAKKGGIKPIIGCEAYISRKDRKIHTPKDAFHIVLLAKNDQRYRNLMHLVSLGYLEGFYYKPRIDKEILREYSEGLIALSACLGGDISRAVLDNEYEKAKELALEYVDIMGKGNYYLEIQQNGIPEQEIVNKALIKISKETDIPLVATNDSHYVLKEHAEAHDILMKIQMKQTISSPKRHESDAYYIRSAEEMWELFKDTPEALENTVKIAERCNVEIKTGTYYLPDFPIPEGFNKTTYFEHVVWEGLEERLKNIPNLTDEKIKIYKDRAQFEIDVISQMGFEGYFLIVWDFIKYAKDNDVPVGPGRGSGAGSIVAYSMQITDIDPIPLDLLFERFLNPDRVSMPDFDIDFCQDKRGIVIDYVKRKYGENRVAQIASFSQLKAKSVVRDVGRVLEVPLKEVDKLAKMIPDELNIDLEKALDQNPKIVEAMYNNPEYKQIIEVGMTLEGLYRQPGVHAAGIVIGNQDLWNYTPIFKGSDGFYVTQFEKNNVEEVGLVKFDFLGLKTLTVIARALEYVNKERPNTLRVDISQIDIEDQNIYKIYSSGNTDGIFQFESAGMKKYLKELKPNSFADIIAMNALYRPGPMENIPTYVARKHKRERVKYDHPAMEEFLKETYGITVYQEQVMLLSRKLGGFTRGEADTLRKAMGKKKIDLLNQLYPKFVKGCKEIHNIDKDLADKIWKSWEEFAKYAFNKSHSACYAYVSLQTAYLKYYHPAEFMAAILSLEANDNTKIVKHVESSKEMGLKVIPPDINRSFQDFTVENNDIIFGLGGIKGIGAAAIENIIEERKNGKFESFFDLITRVDGQKVNKKALEALIKAGACDIFKEYRSTLYKNLDIAIQSAQSIAKRKKAGFRSLFGGEDLTSSETDSFELQKYEPWDENERLSFEKEVLGFYISGHPVNRYREEFKRYNFLPIEKQNFENKEQVAVLAIIDQLRVMTTRDKKRMASFVMEDEISSITATCFSRAFAEHETLFSTIKDQPVVFIGRFRRERKFGEEQSKDDEVKYGFTVQDILTLDQYRDSKIESVSITITDKDVENGVVDILEPALKNSVLGKTGIDIKLKSLEYGVLIDFESEIPLSIKVGEDFVNKLDQIVEKYGVNYRYNLKK